jgi:hypothetical protein
MDLSQEWKPPLKPGLSNSEPIIPSYYLKKITIINNGKKVETEYLNIEYLNVIKDDIRNFRKLDNYKLSFIKNDLSDDYKNEIIELMNECLGSVIDLIK